MELCLATFEGLIGYCEHSSGEESIISQCGDGKHR